jgi:hypothetical protein
MRAMPMPLLSSISFLLLLDAAAAYTHPTGRAFATFGNSQTKELIKGWSPVVLAVQKGSKSMLPKSEENLKRYVQARILLEDQNTGCVACSDDSLCVFLCRFSKTEHQLVLPLWQPDVERSEAFKQLLLWHKERFSVGGEEAPHLSGTKLEWADDRQAWSQSLDGFSA